jgi:DNA-binding NarL/FixJ family response regulator
VPSSIVKGKAGRFYFRLTRVLKHRETLVPVQGSITTILVVDDHRLVRRAFRRTLEDAPDLRVVGEASYSDEAIKAARRLRPNVVLMDFALPGLMGGAATERILEAVPETAVLVVSMHSEPTYVRAALDAGARGYLLKSAVNLDLAEAVRQVASGRRVLDSQIVMPTPATGDATRPLTARELEVLRLIVQGKSHREIAATLGICANTVRVHRANMMQALAIHSRVKLTLYAIGRGLVTMHEVETVE